MRFYTPQQWVIQNQTTSLLYFRIMQIKKTNHPVNWRGCRFSSSFQQLPPASQGIEKPPILYDQLSSTHIKRKRFSIVAQLFLLVFFQWLILKNQFFPSLNPPDQLCFLRGKPIPSEIYIACLLLSFCLDISFNKIYQHPIWTNAGPTWCT